MNLIIGGLQLLGETGEGWARGRNGPLEIEAVILRFPKTSGHISELFSLKQPCLEQK